MTNTIQLRLAALAGLMAVLLGAFGAHGLDQILTRYDTVSIWETAVFYHFVHAIMLVLLSTQLPGRGGPWWSFFVGIIIFSGSLYLLAITNVRWLGAITPIGGMSFIVGWVWLMVSADRRITSPDPAAV